MPLTPFEEDMQRAHYYALGALHHYSVTDWDTLYALATGFAYHYTRDMSKGLADAWNAYVAALVLLQQFNRSNH